MSPMPDNGPPKEEPEEGAPEWMVTFGDMMSLLMVFFILIVSFSTMDVIKYRALVGSLKTAFGAKEASFMAGKTGSPNFINVAPTRKNSDAEERAETEEKAKSDVKSMGMEDDVEVRQTEQGVALRVKGNILFDVGNASLRTEANELLGKIAVILKKHPNTVLVEGHTDNVPISTALFKSNWELSAARAASVVRYLIEREGMAPTHLGVMGLSDTRPVASNYTPEGRSRNRRVDFVLSN
ncbi:MAG: OmpA family protein, partial [Candidatus Eisenbacteria bacterium]|nr:OmpA family protein [Candidatus Eisenbacteria bacterium]